MQSLFLLPPSSSMLDFSREKLVAPEFPWREPEHPVLLENTGMAAVISSLPPGWRFWIQLVNPASPGWWGWWFGVISCSSGCSGQSSAAQERLYQNMSSHHSHLLPSLGMQGSSLSRAGPGGAGVCAVGQGRAGFRGMQSTLELGIFNFQVIFWELLPQKALN